MTIDKAIKIKENYLRLHASELYKQIIEADRLSIEALKRLQDARFAQRIPFTIPLPGETKD